MLNIGKLSPGGAEYYVGEIATSAEDYYTGAGESAGRWVGSLRVDLGLEGEVDPEDFRQLLLGRHPGTGEILLKHHRKATTPDEQVDRSPIGGQALSVVAAEGSVGGLG